MQEFRDVLYAHPEAAGCPARDFDALFSAAFSQTLAFGLLVREGTGHRAGPDAWEHMPEEHPLMLTALRVLSQPEIVRDIDIGFDVNGGHERQLRAGTPRCRGRSWASSTFWGLLDEIRMRRRLPRRAWSD
jgi:hypothetical protein